MEGLLACNISCPQVLCKARLLAGTMCSHGDQVGMQGSPEASLCKFGLFLLRAALPPADVNSPPWSAFLSLYELLDEYALHLIQVRQGLSEIAYLLQGRHELLS